MTFLFLFSTVKKIDHSEYESVVEHELEQQGTTHSSVDSKLNRLSTVCHKAAEKAVPSKIIKLKGPTWKASPTVKRLLGVCKENHKHWVDSGKSNLELHTKNINAKRNLRRQLRKEKFNDRKNFYEDLMSEPTTEKFYKLIRRNKGDSRSQASSLIVDGQEIPSPEQQRKSFAQYYEELSVPKNENYDSAFLDLCTVRHELNTQYCDENTMTLDPITKSEVKEAISRLYTKKAPGEFGLTAEHLQHAGNSLIEDITDTFNQIICEN